MVAPTDGRTPRPEGVAGPFMPCYYYPHRKIHKIAPVAIKVDHPKENEMSDDHPDAERPGSDGPRQADQPAGEAAEPASDNVPEGLEHSSAAGPNAPQAPVPPTAPQQEPGTGTRRVTRETHTTTTQRETTTHETSTAVEDILLAPPVYAAPAGEHPRPVG